MLSKPYIMIARKREHFALPSTLEASVLLYLHGAIIMNPTFVRRPEQIRLIMECLQSGLSDYQWCQNQGINPGTFYNWVSKLRKSGYTFPESGSRSSGAPVKQEVVKLELADPETSGSAMAEQCVSCPSSPTPAVSCIAAEIECGNIRVRFYNGADAAVVQNTLTCIGGMSHAW